MRDIFNIKVGGRRLCRTYLRQPSVTDDVSSEVYDEFFLRNSNVALSGLIHKYTFNSLGELERFVTGFDLDLVFVTSSSIII